MNSLYLHWILMYSAMYGIDPHLATAIAMTESEGKRTAIGKHGEIGIFQILPEYSNLDVKELLNPRLNIKEGLSKLAEAKNQCIHQMDHTWIICYNVGVAGGKKIKHPKQFKYYRKVMSAYRRNK